MTSYFLSRHNPALYRAGRCLLLAASWFAIGLLTAGSPAARGDGARYIRSGDGVPICIYEAGNPAGPPILWIHGFSQSYWVFKLQFESSLAKDYRLLAYDLRGQGCSGKPWDAKFYTTRTSANDTAAVIKAFKLTRPLLVGWSYGGYVIVDYIRHYGDRGLAGAILVGSNAGLPPPPSDAAGIERVRAGRERNRNAAADVATQIQGGHAFVSVMTARPASPELADIMFATNQMLPVYARRAMTDRNLQNDDVIPKIGIPVLLLAGDKDLSQQKPVLEAVAGKLKNARVALIAGAGHATFIDAPEEFERELRQFATQVQPR